MFRPEHKVKNRGGGEKTVSTLPQEISNRPPVPGSLAQKAVVLAEFLLQAYSVWYLTRQLLSTLYYHPELCMTQNQFLANQAV